MSRLAGIDSTSVCNICKFADSTIMPAHHTWRFDGWLGWLCAFDDPGSRVRICITNTRFPVLPGSSHQKKGQKLRRKLDDSQSPCHGLMSPARQKKAEKALEVALTGNLTVVLSSFSWWRGQTDGGHPVQRRFFVARSVGSQKRPQKACCFCHVVGRRNVVVTLFSPTRMPGWSSWAAQLK
jgi:hypothetical protein